jgi:hypothetical protein
MTSIRPMSSIWCSICPTNLASTPNLYLDTDSQIRQHSGRWGRRTAYTYAVDFADRSGRIVQRESNLELSALRTVVPEGAVYWRVEASASEGGETAVSGWLPIGPDVSAVPPDALADLKAPLR